MFSDFLKFQNTVQSFIILRGQLSFSFDFFSFRSAVIIHNGNLIAAIPN